MVYYTHTIVYSLDADLVRLISKLIHTSILLAVAIKVNICRCLKIHVGKKIYAIQIRHGICDGTVKWRHAFIVTIENNHENHVTGVVSQ